jgi:hypothetical protein
LYCLYSWRYFCVAYIVGDIFCIAYVVGDICAVYIVGDIFCVAYIVGDICVDAGQLGPRTGNAPRHHANQSPFPVLKKRFFLFSAKAFICLESYIIFIIYEEKIPQHLLASLEIKAPGKDS